MARKSPRRQRTKTGPQGRPEEERQAALPDAERAQAEERGPDVVDELGEALGVPRAPDEEFRTSQEILEGRDRYRWDDEGLPERDEREDRA
jgi:hypothetical protein